MITIVCGKLGSGKSYDCVRLIADHLQHGGCVRTNISLDASFIGKSLGRKIYASQIGSLSANDNPFFIPTGDRRGRGTRRTMVVLDEALNWFASSTSKDDSKKSTWGEWLRQSDKLGQDVYFIAQNFERSAKWIRELAHVCREVIALRDASFLYFFKLRWFVPYASRWYVVRPYDCATKQALRFEFHQYRPLYWRMYDTAETYGFVGAESAYDACHIWPAYNPPLWILFLSLLGFVVYLLAVWIYLK